MKANPKTTIRLQGVLNSDCIEGTAIVGEEKLSLKYNPLAHVGDGAVRATSPAAASRPMRTPRETPLRRSRPRPAHADGAQSARRHRRADE